MTTRPWLWLYVLVMAVAFGGVPNSARAQTCNERCGHFDDEGGGHLGFGCITGSQGYNCAAEIDHCYIATAGCSDTLQEAVLDDSGRLIAVVKYCAMNRTFFGATDARDDGQPILIAPRTRSDVMAAPTGQGTVSSDVERFSAMYRHSSADSSADRIV
jgi:hypothetical protein